MRAQLQPPNVVDNWIRSVGVAGARRRRRKELSARLKDLSYYELMALRELIDETAKDPDASRLAAVEKVWRRRGQKLNCKLGSNHITIEDTRDQIRCLHERIVRALSLAGDISSVHRLAKSVTGDGFGWRWMIHILYMVHATPEGCNKPSSRPVKRHHREFARFFRERLEACFSEAMSLKPRPRVMADAVTRLFLDKMSIPITQRYLKMILNGVSPFVPPGIRN